MSTASYTAATVGSLAAGCFLLVFCTSHLASSSESPKRDLADLEDEIVAVNDFITPNDVVAVFDKIFMTMQQVVLQLSQQVQQIQMSGQAIPEKQLRHLLKGEFERTLTSCQAQVFEDNDVDCECFEEATWEFMETPEEYPKVKRAVERFQKLYDSISGEATVGWTPNKVKNDLGDEPSVAKKDLSAEELMTAANVYFDAITEKMMEVAKSWKESGKDLKDPQVSKQFQLEASTDANEAAEDKLKNEMGISMVNFRSALDKHSRIPAVGQTLGMLQIKQQQELMAAGVPMI